jgi:hypothetical protein
MTVSLRRAILRLGLPLWLKPPWTEQARGCRAAPLANRLLLTTIGHTTGRVQKIVILGAYDRFGTTAQTVTSGKLASSQWAHSPRRRSKLQDQPENRPPSGRHPLQGCLRNPRGRVANAATAVRGVPTDVSRPYCAGGSAPGPLVCGLAGPDDLGSAGRTISPRNSPDRGLCGLAGRPPVFLESIPTPPANSSTNPILGFDNQRTSSFGGNGK